MIVIDASAMVEALVGRAPAQGLLTALAGEVAAPHVVDVEVLSVLRGLVAGGKLKTPAADQARADHFAFQITRYDTAPLAERVWQLRHRFTAHDACYLALAEALGAPLFTCDRRLDTGGHEARLVVLTSS